MVGKSRERDKQRKKEHNILCCRMCSQRVTVLSHIANYSFLFVLITCRIKGRENESLMINVTSQSAVKEIRGQILFLVQLWFIGGQSAKEYKETYSDRATNCLHRYVILGLLDYFLEFCTLSFPASSPSTAENCSGLQRPEKGKK